MPNGCSGGQSWLYRKLTNKPLPWEYCCNEHDLAYEQGGPEEWRLWADQMLRDCMVRAGFPNYAPIYYFFVRIFGTLHWGKPNKNSLEVT